MTIAAVERALKLMEALAGAPDGVDLSLLAERLDLPFSATHRLLATLAERGFVRQDAHSGAYGLTLKLAQLAFRDLDSRGLPDAGQIVLDRLAAATREYCRLAVVDGGDLIWIARSQGATAGLRYEPPMGSEPVLHATATGKAWLASLPETEALRIVFARGFDGDERTGPNALEDVDALRAHLDETRRRGFAIAVEEGEVGIVAMATTFRAGPDPAAPVAGPQRRRPVATHDGRAAHRHHRGARAGGGRNGRYLVAAQTPDPAVAGSFECLGQPEPSRRNTGMSDNAANASPAAAESGHSRFQAWGSAIAWPLMSFAVLLAAWEWLVPLARIPEYILPVPSAFFERLWTDRVEIFRHTLVTGNEIVLGFLMAAVISIPLGYVIVSVRILEKAIYPVIVFFQLVPKIAIAPLFVVWFGFGLFPKVLLTFLLCFFPTLVASMTASARWTSACFISPARWARPLGRPFGMCGCRRR